MCANIGASGVISSKLVRTALERNFNGVEPDEFERIAKTFFDCIAEKGISNPIRNTDTSPSPVQTLLDSWHGPGQHKLDLSRGTSVSSNRSDTSDNWIRYKLVIDESPDQSFERVMFATGLLDPVTVRVVDGAGKTSAQVHHRSGTHPWSL